MSSGSSVAVVGNAGYLSGLGQGRQIDQYDLVVRMNNFQISGFEEAVGTRTDIFFTNFYHDIRYDNPAARKARFLVSSVPNNFRKRKRYGLHSRHAVHITRGVKELGGKEVFVPSISRFLNLVQRIGKYPTTGAMAIIFTLEYLAPFCGSIYLTGFSFFQGRSHYFDPRNVNVVNHAPAREKLLLRERIGGSLRSLRITMDPIMAQHLFKEEEHERHAGSLRRVS